MNPEARKTKFVLLLQELLASKCNGVQARLAEKIEIGTSSISRWLSGQIDPINLETAIFSRIAILKGCSTEELAQNLGFIQANRDSQKKFQLLLKQILSDKTQEELGELIGVSQIAISNWLNPEKKIDPGKIPAGTMFAIAYEKGWTFDNLLTYLGLQPEERTKPKFLIKYQLELSELSLAEKEELLVWLLNSINIKINNPDNIQEIITTKRDRSVCIVLEQEDIVIASRYTANLLIHLQLEPENITVGVAAPEASATISKAPESLEDIDLLIFDISTEDSPSIPLLENIYFDGDIIVFAPTDLPEAIKESISTNVTEILLKPIDWSQLKDKPYFF